MESVLRKLAVLWVFAMIASLPAYGQDQSQSNDWEIRLMPYGWIPTMKATSTVNGLSGDIKLEPGDVLDYLEFGAMGRIEAWKGKWGLMFDGIYMYLGASDSFQGRREAVDFSLDLDVRLGMADVGLMYRLFEESFGKDNQQRLAFEPYAGLRYGYLRQKADLDVAIEGVGSVGRTMGTSEDWVEPFVGGRVIWDLNDKWAFHLLGDAGGFGIGSASDLTWQLIGGVDYKLTKNMILNAGYRYVSLDYSRGSGSDEFGMDLQAYGPIVGMTILF